MTTTVAIINWNSGRCLRTCIESLLAAAVAADIVVIDNASTDASLEYVQGFRDRIDFIRNSVNRGFAAAVNQAFQSTSTALVLILNPDIRVPPGSIAALEEFMKTHPKAAAIGGYVNEKYLPRALPTAASIVKENLGIPARSRRLTTNDKAVRVEQPAAAALLVRREAYEEIGGFDERFYPAWYEDVDFCHRLKAAGWEIYFAPKVEFFHEGGYSAAAMGAEAFVRAYYTNQLRYARKHLGPSGSAVVRASLALGMLGRMIGRPRHAAAYGKALIGALGRW